MKSNLFIILLLLIFSCKEKSSSKIVSELVSANLNSGELINIDFSKPEYKDLKAYVNDTITSDGWKINYLVKNDSTRLKDLYIKWSKGDNSEIFEMENVLLMRRYFIPILTNNNANFIYMTHGCGTSCSGVLVLSKELKPKAKDFLEVIEYNTDLDQIVYIPERSYNLDTFEIAISDLKKGIDKSVKFKNRCNLSPENGCVDSINFNKKHIDIFATLLNPKTGKTAKEINRIKIIE